MVLVGGPGLAPGGRGPHATESVVDDPLGGIGVRLAVRQEAPTGGAGGPMRREWMLLGGAILFWIIGVLVVLFVW